MSQEPSMYVNLWRRTPRNLAFLLTSLPLAVAGGVIAITGISLGVGLLVVWVGLPIIVVTLIASRWLGTVELTRLRGVGRAVEPPNWIVGAPITGVWSRFRRYLADRRYWKYLLHSAVVNVVVGIATWTIAVSWLSVGLAGMTNSVWTQFGAASDNGVWLQVAVLTFFPWFSGANDPATLFIVEIVLGAAVGLVFLGTLPFLAQGLVNVHAASARSLLGEPAGTKVHPEEAALAGPSRGAAVLGALDN